MNEMYTVFNNRLAGKIMAKGFVLISMGKKYYDGDKYRNTYQFRKSEALLQTIANLTGHQYKG